METEIKLGPAEPSLAAAVFADTALLPPAGAEMRIGMRTVYYDDPAGSFATRRETLRLRQENGRSVCTFKTAPRGLSRLELEVEAPDVQAGAAALAALPDMPPQAAEALRAGIFVPVCGARFLRRTRLCRVEDCTFHLCLDEGVLENGPRTLPLCEIELELVSGFAGDLEAAARRLMDRYGLPLCTLSKQQRALALGGGNP